jgi:uncharacterized tellurite resistance protein B-like protein
MTQSSIEAEIGLCILFSAVDGEISEKEIGALSNRVGHLLGDDFDVMRLPALLDGELGSISEHGVDDYVARLPARIPSERRYEAVRAACVVACADGLAPEEEEVVRQVCVVLEVDADEIIGRVGARNDTIAPIGETHDDEPNESTKLIEEQLVARGWVDPMQALRDAGVALSGFGALALQYESPNGHHLRVEHHTCDGSLHLHVTDQSEDDDTELVLFPEGRERELVTALTSMQDAVTLETLDTHIALLRGVARVCIFQGESLVEIEKIS